jgi:RHS repeat-associated protein
MQATINSTNGTQYTTTDILGSPRVVTNSSGAVVSRHDYMPFGEELFAGTGGRTTIIGFGGADGMRKKFTGYERDGETGLDFAQARYFASTQGRFNSPDPLSGHVADPQSWNRYTYVGNNPLGATDPTGMVPTITNHGHFNKGEFIVDTRDEESPYDAVEFARDGSFDNMKTTTEMERHLQNTIARLVAAYVAERALAYTTTSVPQNTQPSGLQTQYSDLITLNGQVPQDWYGRQISGAPPLWGIQRNVLLTVVDANGKAITGTGMTVSESVYMFETNTGAKDFATTVAVGSDGRFADTQAIAATAPPPPAPSDHNLATQTITVHKGGHDYVVGRFLIIQTGTNINLIPINNSNAAYTRWATEQRQMATPP